MKHLGSYRMKDFYVCEGVCIVKEAGHILHTSDLNHFDSVAGERI